MNYKNIADPNIRHFIEEKETKSRIGIVKILIFSVVWMFLLMFFGVAMDLNNYPIKLLIFGIIVYRIVIRKYFGSYKTLHIPVKYEEWTDSEAFSFKQYTEGLEKEEWIKTYWEVCDFCNFKADVSFNISQINVTRDVPISNYILNKLYEAGYLIKPKRGFYSLNPLKIEKIQKDFKEYEEGKRKRYDAFIEETEKYNEKVRQYNFELTEKCFNNKK